jgi:hypothetical protein
VTATARIYAAALIELGVPRCSQRATPVLMSRRTVTTLLGARLMSNGAAPGEQLGPRYVADGPITAAEFEALPLQRHDWHPDWTYSILPGGP